MRYQYQIHQMIIEKLDQEIDECFQELLELSIKLNLPINWVREDINDLLIK